LCASRDIDHIGEKFAPRGPWVLLIKKALNAWAAKQSPPLPALTATDFFDAATGDRVALYKSRQTPPLLNFAGKIDRIVGKKTVAALDDELPRLGGGGVTPPSPLTMKALAERDKATSILWARGAISGLTDTRNFLLNASPLAPIPSRLVAVTLGALETHFNLVTATIPKIDFINQVLGLYVKGLAVLTNSTSFFVDDTTSAEAAKGTPAHVPFGSGKVNFTPSFKARSGDTGFGDGCRAAMVLHEPFHIVDHPAASLTVNHVPEFIEAYDIQPAMNQLHNAHSYASFAQQVFFDGRDTRFGAGKPAQ
jgi:hypothetical protein